MLTDYFIFDIEIRIFRCRDGVIQPIIEPILEIFIFILSESLDVRILT